MRTMTKCTRQYVGQVAVPLSVSVALDSGIEAIEMQRRVRWGLKECVESDYHAAFAAGSLNGHERVSVDKLDRKGHHASCIVHDA